MQDQEFDVFLCHNSEDKPAVINIAKQLQARNIKPWLDEWEIRPGFDWQDILEQQIEQIQSAAIFVGGSGFGPWQSREIKAFLREFNHQCPIIPVLLPGAPKEPKLPVFLKGNVWVDFRVNAPEPLGRLIWGITQQKPTHELIDSASKLILSSRAESENKASDLAVLENLLSSANFKEADKQTKKIALDNNQGKCLTAPILRLLPLELLSNMDYLWMKYSNGKFGLKVQEQLWTSCLEPQKSRFNPFAKPMPVSDADAWKQFGYLVGWRDEDRRVLPDSKIKFSIESPLGCFPQTRRWLHGGYGNDVKQFVILAERISEIKCRA